MTHVHLKPHGDRWENGSFVEELWEEWICKCDCGQIPRLVLRFPCVLINPPTQLSLTSWCFPSRSGRVSSKGDGRSFLDIPKVSSVTGLCSKASPVFAAVKPVCWRVYLICLVISVTAWSFTHFSLPAVSTFKRYKLCYSCKLRGSRLQFLTVTLANSEFFLCLGEFEEESKQPQLSEQQKHQLKHRELFLSRQFESLPATHIR